MRFKRTLNVVGAHAGGEVGDVIVGGVLDVPGKTMFEKMMHMWKKDDAIRQLLLNEPRGRVSMSANLVVPPCHPEADAGLIIMETDEYVPMSGSNIICTSTVLLETGMIPMKDQTTIFNMDTAAGLVRIVAECDLEAGKARTIAFENVPAFVFALDYELDVPELGKINVDVAWGGMIYVLVDAASAGLKIENRFGKELVEMGEKIKQELRKHFDPVHPENHAIHGVANLEWTEPLELCENGEKTAKNTVIVSPGRCDRSACGTGTCARLAVLHARGQLQIGEKFRHQSITGSEFFGEIRGTTTVGGYAAVLPTVTGSAWISSFKQVVLDPSDPFPLGFRVGDAWLPEDESFIASQVRDN
ncbi:proline racemase [Thozetella sp. PMI_491]|nr:proline racemase [Thozetella sp. PMI_491]